MPGRQYVTLSKQQAMIGGALIGRDSVPNFKDTTLTNAQILALRATPITLAPAPGTGVFREFIRAVLVCKAAAGAYTETADNLVIRQTNTTGVILSQAIETTGWLDQAAIKATNALAKVDTIGALQAKALVLHNSGDGEFGGGNAANTMFVRCYFIDHSLASVGVLA